MILKPYKNGKLEFNESIHPRYFSEDLISIRAQIRKNRHLRLSDVAVILSVMGYKDWLNSLYDSRLCTQTGNNLILSMRLRADKRTFK